MAEAATTMTPSSHNSINEPTAEHSTSLDLQQEPRQDTDSPFSGLPDELWELILDKTATFLPRHFHTVLENLIRNPNITSSAVFRADIYYDSSTHAPTIDENGHESFDEVTKHLQEVYRPRPFSLEGYKITKTIVRKMIPRNPALDDALVQTCHFLARSTITTDSQVRSSNAEEDDHILVMIPHADEASSIPFYHPKIRALALRYLYTPSTAEGRLSIYYSLFVNQQLDNRLERTALNLLTTVHKHATGQAAGYTKRVHHDQIVPQNQFQDTYTRLKLTYAKDLIAKWAEGTDPTKHVFEDLGIAAFLIELWKDMYPDADDFPGFVDIGCGNGVLVNILIQEGYRGWGFDARARKSWTTFPEAVQDILSARILVPSVLRAASEATPSEAVAFHNGRFPNGTFIVSNHADELTPWTPLLAYLNASPFIAIPCCSHNLAGARCRFNVREKTSTNEAPDAVDAKLEAKIGSQDGPGPASGSLARPKNASKQPSAYQSLTTYVTQLAEELGFDVTKEMLRIPSTRNAAIVGRLPKLADGVAAAAEQEGEVAVRSMRISHIVQREVGEINQVVTTWLSQTEKISKCTSSGH